MADGGYISDESFIMVADSIVNVDIFGNIIGGNGSSIDDFDGFWVF
jgi:hypothetical protein